MDSLAHDNHSFESALPFASFIDWPMLSLQLVAKLPAPCQGLGADWMAKWHRNEEALTVLRSRGQAAFRAHLDVARNPTGVAHTMLLELMARQRKANPICQLTWRRSRKGIAWSSYTEWVCRARQDNESVAETGERRR